MPLSREQHEQAMEWLRDVFQSDLVRLGLSLLIILSVLPFGWVQDFSMIFFALFAIELFLRISLLRHDLAHRSLNRVEIVFLCFDVLATLSFLPIEVIYDDIRYLRLFRLSRMMLLFGYWGPIVREIWYIMAKRERRYQVFFVIASAVILSFISAILMTHFQSQGVDFNEDGNPLNDRSFWVFLWWSFRQIQDPGNLLKDPNASLAFFFSLLLTICGMFLFSFLIGIGTSVVEELVRLGKERRLGYRKHSVICNAGQNSRVLLEELFTYYAKSLRNPRIVVMGPSPTRYPYMLQGPVQRLRYRQGRPLSQHDLQRVDADRATRVILLGRAGQPLSDSEVVSQILSVREVNRSCDIYAELVRPDNEQAAREAGGAATVPVLAERMLGLFLANIVVFPGVQRLYWQLLTSAGDEIYTCLFNRGAMADYQAPTGKLMPFSELLERAHRGHGVTLLGYLVEDKTEPSGFRHVINPGSPRDGAPTPPEVPPVSGLAGFFGVADNFSRLKRMVESLPDIAVSQALPPPPPRLSLGSCSVLRQMKQVLVCGYHEGLPDFCEQLIRFTGQPTLFLMVPDARTQARARRAFVGRSETDPSTPGDTSGRLKFTGGEDETLRYAPVEGAEGPRGELRLIIGDWSGEDALRGLPRQGYELRRMDAVIFTYDPGADDPDARTSLGLIKLMRLRESGEAELRPGMRIVCEVQSSEKANLFRKRYGEPVPGEPEACHPVAIVPAERLRNALLAQAVFVPGIAAIYRELLSEAGQEIRRLLVEPRAEEGEVWTYGALLTQLYREHGLLLLAVELRRDPAPGEPEGRTRLVVNPQPRDDHYRFAAARLQGVYVIGEANYLPQNIEPCSNCPARPPAPGEPDAP